MSDPERKKEKQERLYMKIIDIIIGIAIIVIIILSIHRNSGIGLFK